VCTSNLKSTVRKRKAAASVLFLYCRVWMSNNEQSIN
jgi:hypothetical protein